MLEVLGIGLDLPPAKNVRELVRAAGGDPAAHDGWDNICVGADGDHPSTMATAALSAALEKARIGAGQLDLVISVGVSRDYPPSWSTAAEVMRLLGASDTCVGFDLSVGCLGTLAGLNTALGWLQTMGGGYAAIITAERWTQTVDRSSVDHKVLWGHADGAGAIVVSQGRPGPSLATFHGAAFTSHPAFNGLVLLKYGGTRFPTPAPGENAQMRTLAPVPASEIWAVYAAGYARAFAALQQRFGVKPARLICNQISPNVVSMIAEASGVAERDTCWTGHEYGHVGGADVMIGLRRLIDTEQLDGPVAMAASVPFAIGAGLFSPHGVPLLPEDRRR